jgi:hypothetical protein
MGCCRLSGLNILMSLDLSLRNLKREFHVGEKVLLYRSRLRLFAGKLLSKCEGPFVIEEVYRSGAIKIVSLKDNTTQVVNGQRLKHYIS